MVPGMRTHTAGGAATSQWRLSNCRYRVHERCYEIWGAAISGGARPMNQVIEFGMAVLSALLLAIQPAPSDAGNPSAPAVTPRPPTTEEPVPVRILAASHLTLPDTASFERMDELVIAWQVGPACSGSAGALEGEFDHVNIDESKSEVQVTLYLRDASVNPEPTSGDVCPIGLPWHVRVVPLSKPLGKRVVRDMACARPCRVPRMDAVQREYFLSQLRS